MTSCSDPQCAPPLSGDSEACLLDFLVNLGGTKTEPAPGKMRKRDNCSTSVKGDLNRAHSYDNVGTKELGLLRNHLFHIEGLGLPENIGFQQTWKRRL